MTSREKNNMDAVNLSPFTNQYLWSSWIDFAEFLLKHSDQLLLAQQKYWQNHPDLYQVNIELNDKRFRHEEWQKNIIFDFIRRSYLLLSQQTGDYIKHIDFQDEKLAKKFQFISRQIVDLFSPGNFVNTNPEVLAKMIETNGESLIVGLQRLQNDLKQGKNVFQISNTDVSAFEIGKNIACTKGKIIFQNDLMQLIQYTPTTLNVYQKPLLIVPPWVNKYYILDLQPENSLVKWLVDQGHIVYMISWINPDSRLREKKFADYLNEGPYAALKIIRKHLKNVKINILGYCIGGTLVGCLLSYLQQKQKSAWIESATFLTTLFDFSQPGELGVFIDHAQINLLKKHMQKKGYVDGQVFSSVFNVLRANDLIWSSFVNQYLKGESPKPFDLLYWNADATNVPVKTHIYYLKNMYLKNLLIEGGQLKLKGVPIDLKTIKTPCYFLAAEDDHIIPWKSAYQSASIFNCRTRFVLTGSGHVAGVINPPSKNKYGYWVQNEKSINAETFLENASHHPGSWWQDWNKWLTLNAGEKIPAIKMSLSKHVIEEAPGSYVKVKLADIDSANKN